MRGTVSERGGLVHIHAEEGDNLRRHIPHGEAGWRDQVTAVRVRPALGRGWRICYPARDSCSATCPDWRGGNRDPYFTVIVNVSTLSPGWSGGIHERR